MSLRDFVAFITTYTMGKVKKVKEVEVRFSRFSLLMIPFGFMGQELIPQRVVRNFDVSVYFPGFMNVAGSDNLVTFDLAKQAA